MQQLEHPDFLLHRQQVKQITRGGRQAADDQAMEKYWLALESGASKEEAAEVYSKTYIQFLNSSHE